MPRPSPGCGGDDGSRPSAAAPCAGGAAVESQAEKIAQRLAEGLQESLLQSFEERLAATEESIVTRLQYLAREGRLETNGELGVSSVASSMFSTHSVPDVIREHEKRCETTPQQLHLERRKGERMCIVGDRHSTTEFLDPDQFDKHRHEKAMAVGRISTVKSDDSTMGNRRPLARLIQNPKFDVFLTMVIVANALFIGFETDLVANLIVSDNYMGLVIVRHTFTFVFLLELIVRIAGGGRHFFTSHDQWSWNWLDCCIVASSLVEVGLDIAAYIGGMGSGDVTHGKTQFRLLRILRATRLIRGIRVTRLIRFLRALRVLVHQIVSTIKSLFWALLLLSIIIYLFAVLFTQATTAYRETSAEGLAVITYGSGEDPLFTYWATIPRSMYSLFMAITGGISWEELARPLSRVQGIWVFVFITYICLAQMAVLNVLTGVFCQNAIDSAAHDQELQVQAVLLDREKYLKAVNAIFKEMDTDRSGTISLQEFKDHLDDETTSAHLESLGLDTSECWTLFKLMDMDKGNIINLDEFVYGCLRLKGNAKSVDMAKLSYEQRWMAKRLSLFMERTDRALGTLMALTYPPKFPSQNGST